MKEVRISVITVCRNAMNEWPSLSANVLSAMGPRDEWVVQDGASTDGSAECVRGLADSRVKGESCPDGGIYDAMNKGISLASGKLIGITNSDDWYEDNTLEVVWNKFSDGVVDQSNSMIYGIERVWKDDKIFNVQRRGASFISESVLPHSTFFVSKEVYNKYGAFDLSIKVLADYDFICRCVSKGVKLEEVDVVISNFRLGGISSSYFDFYSDYYMIQHKYGFISDKKYKEYKCILNLKKIINRFMKKW